MLFRSEVLRQRLEGIKNEKGVYITPAFPKLVYVLDEHNCLKGGKYDYITELAVKCSAKRMYPDYISAKKMRENYEGNVFSPMGCRSFLGTNCISQLFKKNDKLMTLLHAPNEKKLLVWDLSSSIKKGIVCFNRFGLGSCW